MPRLGSNGGLMGPRRVSTTSNASGSWLLDEQCDAQRAGIWPVIPAGEIPVGSITYSQSSVYSGVSPADNATMTNGSFLDSRTATNANGSTYGVIEWVRMDLGAVYQVGSVVIGTGTSNVPGGWSKIWSENRDVEYSIDGTNWTYAFTTPGIHGGQPPTVFPADGIYTYPVDFTARYIRFSKGAVGGNYVLISEFYALAPGQTYDP
jgi:F5/8 type C domain